MTRTEILRQAIQEKFPPKYGSLSRAAKKAGIRPGSLSNALSRPSGPSVGLSVRCAKAWGMDMDEILSVVGVVCCEGGCFGGGERLTGEDGWNMEIVECSVCEGKGWINISEKDID